MAIGGKSAVQNIVSKRDAKLAMDAAKFQYARRFIARGGSPKDARYIFGISASTFTRLEYQVKAGVTA